MAYVDDFLVDVDVQVDGFLHGEALRSERGLEVHILRRPAPAGPPGLERVRHHVGQ